MITDSRVSDCLHRTPPAEIPRQLQELPPEQHDKLVSWVRPVRDAAPRAHIDSALQAKLVIAAADDRFLFTAIAAGALGSHTLTSFADYMGNRALSKSWLWWFILRTPIGIAHALLFYVVLRGGLIVPTLPSGSSGADTTRFLNPYGVAAISALAGMFSKQTTDKLREILDTLFRTHEPVNRAV